MFITVIWYYRGLTKLITTHSWLARDSGNAVQAFLKVPLQIYCRHHIVYLLLTRMNYVNMNLICSLNFHWYLAILIIMGWLFCFILNLQSWRYSKKRIIQHEKQPLHANQVQLNCIWDEHAFLFNFRQYVAFTLPFGTEPFNFTMKIHAILIHWWADGILTGVHEAVQIKVQCNSAPRIF